MVRVTKVLRSSSPSAPTFKIYFYSPQLGLSGFVPPNTTANKSKHYVLAVAVKIRVTIVVFADSGERDRRRYFYAGSVVPERLGSGHTVPCQ